MTILETAANCDTLELSQIVVDADHGLAERNVDPYIKWSRAMSEHWDKSNNPTSDAVGDFHYEKWCQALERLTEAKPTTMAGVVAGLRVTLADYIAFHGDVGHEQEERLILAVLRNAVEFMERTA